MLESEKKRPPPVRKTIRLEFNETLARIMIYMLTAMLLVAVGLAVAFGWVAYAAMNESATFREAAHDAQSNSQRCRIQLERADAKLEAVRNLFLYARGEKPDEEGVGGTQ